MRARLLLVLAIVPAAGDDPSPAADPRRPVSVHLRTGEFLRAEYVDSAWMASPAMEPEARTRALGLWRQYGTPRPDSLVLHVSNRAEAELDCPSKHTRFFRFTSAELGGAPDSTAASAAPAADPARPVAVEIRTSEYIRAEFIDSALVAVGS